MRPQKADWIARIGRVAPMTGKRSNWPRRLSKSRLRLLPIVVGRVDLWTAGFDPLRERRVGLNSRRLPLDSAGATAFSKLIFFHLPAGEGDGKPPPTRFPGEALLLGCFLSLQGGILGFCGGVILVVARHSLSDLFRREFTVVFRVQNFG